jgi:hypothetical protein
MGAVADLINHFAHRTRRRLPVASDDGELMIEDADGSAACAQGRAAQRNNSTCWRSHAATRMAHQKCVSAGARTLPNASTTPGSHRVEQPRRRVTTIIT